MQSELRVKTCKRPKGDTGKGTHYLVIDDRPLPQLSWCRFLRLGGRGSQQTGLSAGVSDPVAVDRLRGVTLGEISRHFDFRLTVGLPEITEEFGHEVTIEFLRESRESEPGHAELIFRFRLDYPNWSLPWSPAEYMEAVRQAAIEAAHPTVLDLFEVDLDEVPEYKLVYQASLEFPLGSELGLAIGLAHRVRDRALARLQEAQADAARESLVVPFAFPPPIRAACQQYVLYFVQFLEDLGIKADIEVKEAAGRTLFSVTPREGREALERIREALDVYLELPANPGALAAAARTGDVAVMQLQATVLHLKSQVVLSAALLQAKSAQIEALELSNLRLQQMLVDGGREKPLAIVGASA
ncbi:MAG TPA: hypothetical protein VKA84_17285, partial [Gemmatimonadaceae bacterium]|nr:hypothetical protein [Gemmatimonadaceae bacterium]